MPPIRVYWHTKTSLQWRLPIMYASIFLIAILISDTSQYLILRQNLLASRANAMQQNVSQSRLLLDKYFHLESGTPELVKEACATPNLSDQLAVTFGKFIATTTGSTVSLAVYNSSRTVIDIEPKNALVPKVSSSYLLSVQQGNIPKPLVFNIRSGQVLVTAAPISSRDTGACGLVELSTSMQPLRSLLNEELGIFLLEGFVAFLAVILIGILLTRQALRPLERLKLVAQLIAGGNLGARSNLEPREDEIGILATTMDDMAHKIESTFNAQKESEDRMSRFIADASHELRTPVTALKGYLEVLRRGSVTDPAVLEPALASMAQEAERMKRLVNDLLTLVRLHNSPGSEHSLFDANDELSSLLEEGVPGMTDNIERDFTTESTRIEGDSYAFNTIFRNLLINACIYAKGARQKWSTRIDGDTVKIIVHDDGPGIANEDLPYVFERFYRGEKARTREVGGSGLGLSIVKGLVEANEGRVTIESTSSTGTTVTVIFPRHLSVQQLGKT